VFVRHANIEHLIHCDCHRGTTTIVGDEATASAVLVELGWRRHEDGWRCPVCAEEKHGPPSSSWQAPRSDHTLWSSEAPRSGIHSVAPRRADDDGQSDPRERPTLSPPPGDDE
jgi:hypothetical protein